MSFKVAQKIKDHLKFLKHFKHCNNVISHFLFRFLFIVDETKKIEVVFQE